MELRIRHHQIQLLLGEHEIALLVVDLEDVLQVRPQVDDLPRLLLLR